MSEKNPYIALGTLVEGIDFNGTSGRYLRVALEATNGVGIISHIRLNEDGDYMAKIKGSDHGFYTRRFRVVGEANTADEYEDALAAQDAMAKIEGDIKCK